MLADLIVCAYIIVQRKILTNFFRENVPLSKKLFTNPKFFWDVSARDFGPLRPNTLYGIL
jgi:hypothetical protein